MKRHDFYCKGCMGEVSLYGNIGKNAKVYCKTCKIEMYEEDIKKQTKTKKKPLKKGWGRSYVY